MLDIGWSEMFVILLVALIVIGPKDLPRVARTVGKWVGKGRALAREFQNSIEDMAREAELDDVKKEIERAGRTDLKKSVENTIDPKGELKGAFDPKPKGAAKRGGPAASKKDGGETRARPAPPEREAAGPPAPPAGSQEKAPAAPASDNDAEPERVAAGSS